jgi:hypothetical protein
VDETNASVEESEKEADSYEYQERSTDLFAIAAQMAIKTMQDSDT